MTRSLALALLLLCSAPSVHAAAVRVQPNTAWLERGRGLQRVHADLRFEHTGADTLELVNVEVSAFDAGGHFLARRFVSANGTAPSIRVIPDRRVWRGHPLLVFDAHDAYAHHRRLDTTFEPIVQLGVTHNSGRYAYDLSVVDESGSMWRTDGRHNADWYSWGVPVRAPGAGRVVWAADGRSDWEVGRTSLPFDDIMADATSMMGNSVVIDHENGEFSLLAHFQKGSVRVRIGQRVRQGEPLGLVGDSGSVFTVHLHYELRGGVPLDVDGLPSRFNRLDRWLGRRREAVQDGFVDTGDVIESR